MIKNFNTLLDNMNDYAGANRIPLSGSFELTSRCNLHCSMCYICNSPEAKEGELSAGKWLDIMRQARDDGMLFTLLTGGEPLVRDDFWDIYLEARKLGLLVTLNSNATTITPEVADMFERHTPMRISVTVYGASPEGYRRVTGSANAYERMRRGIDLLKERNIPFRLRTTLTRDTLPELEDIVKLILSYETRPSLTNYIMPGVVDNGNDAVSQRLTPEETREASMLVEKTIFEYFSENGNPFEEERLEAERERSLDRLLPLDSEQENLHRIYSERRNNTAFFCQAGFTHFWATYDGMMTMCALSREPALDLKKLSFGEAFKALGKAVEAIPVCEECEECEMKQRCSSCPAKLFCENGRYDLKADYLCSFARSDITVRE